MYVLICPETVNVIDVMYCSLNNACMLAVVYYMYVLQYLSMSATFKEKGYLLITKPHKFMKTN